MLKCRACLSSKERLVPFDNTTIDSYHLLTSLKVKEADGLPQVLCELCFNTIETFVTFRLNCINSEQILKAEYGGSSTNQAAKSGSYAGIKLEAVNPIDDDVDIGADNFMGADDGPSAAGEDAQVKDEAMDDDEMEVKHEITTGSDKADPILSGLGIEKQSVVKRLSRGRRKNTVDVKLKKPLKAAKDSKVKREKKVDKKPVVKRVRTRVQKEKKEKKCPVKVPEVLNCGLCHQTFESRDKLGPHIETHEGETSCQICGANLPGSWEMALSHRYSHIELKRGLLECHLCGYRYGTKRAFESHYIVHHILKQTKDFACIYCFKPYPDRRKLQKHMSLHSEREYICDYCKKSYSRKSALKVHLQTHSPEMPFQCDQCPKRFRFNSNLTSHRSAVHMPEPIYCKTCHRHFPDDQRLRSHQCRTSKQCNICGKLISKSGRLRLHLLVHTNERPFKCERCPATFKSSSALKAHRNRHDNIRPHNCPHCDRTFFTGCVLKKHIAWIHTGERKHVCKVCGKGFAALHNLRVHMKVHGEYLIQSKKDQLANVNEPDTSLH